MFEMIGVMSGTETLMFTTIRGGVPGVEFSTPFG